MQIRFDAFFDFQGLFLCPNEADEPIVSVANIFQASEVGVGRVLRRKLLCGFAQRSCFLRFAFFSHLPCPPVQFVVAWMGFTPVSFGVSRNERGFDVLVELVEVDVGKNGADDASLWRSTVGGLVLPVFQVACFEQSTNQAQEAPIVDVLRQRGKQQIMVQAVKAGGDISLDEPGGPKPAAINFLEGTVASSCRSKAMGAVTELRFVI